MLKLFFRFFLFCLILSMLIAFVLVKFYSYLETRYAQQLITNNFNLKYQLIIDYLRGHPSNTWGAILSKIEPQNSSIFAIISIKSAPLFSSEIQKLNKGQVIYQYEQAGLIDKLHPSIVYKKIENTNYILQEKLDFSRDEKTQRYFGWVASIIALKLESISKQNWKPFLSEISMKYGLPISVVNFSQLSNEDRKKLISDKWLIKWPNREKPNYELSYYLLPDNYALQFGPIKYSPINAYKLYFVFLAGLVVIELIMLIIAFTYAASLNKLNRLADHYGHGEFDTDIRINKQSNLYPLFINLKLMGNRINHLIEAQKELIHVVAHELRTPLSRLEFSLEMFKDINKEEIDRRISTMKIDLNELENLISEILTYSKLSSIHYMSMKSIDLNVLLKSIINKLNDPKIKFVSDNKKLNIIGDHLNITRAIQNIIQNALRFSTSIVKVTLNIIDTTRFQLEIEDDGPGIPMELREKVFQPFIQVNQESSNNYGLGLAIAKKIIEQHDWQISIEDSELGGAKLIIANQ